MRLIFHRRTYKILIGVIVLAVAALVVSNLIKSKNSDQITTTVDRGEVNETIAVSGFVEAKNTAQLAFPATGVVTEVFVEEGSEVKAGEVLATLASGKLVADRNEAVAALRLAQAQMEETLAGPTTEERLVTETTVANAASTLSQTETEQAEKVESARRTLLSNDLEAVATDPKETAIAPTISGTYTCDTEGAYTINLYGSSAASGYSYQMNGLESGAAPAYTDQATALGNCGLFIQFDENSVYSNSEWTINIPNKRSSTYLTYQNAYDLALKQQANALRSAGDALSLAQEKADQANAPARGEVVSQRQASISQARARVDQIDALLADRSIVAPFDGTVTSVNITSGETAGATPVITVLAQDAFELKARIPEIDVRKITAGQRVNVEFDASAEETLEGEIKYISPLASEIDGVAYFDAIIILDTTPDWIRSGLNADIDIIIGTSENTLRLPKRFLIRENGKTYAQVGEEKIEVEVLFTGNDGFTAISGLREGDEVIAP